MTTIKARIGMTPMMEAAADFFNGLDAPKYFVGGCVRDRLVGIEPKDVDLITRATPDEVEDYIKGKGRKALRIGKRFGTLGVKLDGEVVEVTTYRKEIYDFQSRKPKVTFSQELTEDLLRRDFTINSMVATMGGHVKDYTGGYEDLRDRVIRSVGNAKTRFKEDPLRIMRAVRFATRLGAEIEEGTLSAMESRRFELYRVSRERVKDELIKLMADPRLSVANLRTLWETRIWEVIFPAMQLQHYYDQKSPYHDMALDTHSANTAVLVGRAYEGAEDRGLRVLTGLLHDVAKPFTAHPHPKWGMSGRVSYFDHERVGARMVEDWARAQRFSNAEVEFMATTVEGHLKDDSWLREFDNASKAKKVRI